MIVKEDNNMEENINTVETNNLVQNQDLQAALAAAKEEVAPIQTRGLPKLVFDFDNSNLKPNVSTALQNFAFEPGSTDIIYYTQATAEGLTTYITRCKITNGIAKATSRMTLPGYGHGESLEITKENNKVYIWIGSRYNAPASENKWSTTISRIVYDENSKNAAGVVAPKEEIVIKDWLYAQNSHTEIVKNSSVWRLAFTRYGGRFMVWIKLPGSGSYYSAYSMDALTPSIEKYAKTTSSDKTRKYYSMKSSDKALQTKMHFKYTTGGNDPSPGGVFQGMMVTKREGKWYLVIGGGNTSEGKPASINIYQITASSMSSLKKTVTLYEKDYAAPMVVEIEGLKMVTEGTKEKLYFGLIHKNRMFSINTPAWP